MAARIGFISALLIACIALAISGASMTHARSAGDPARTITTTGHGSVNVVPDEATVSVGDQNMNVSARAALNANARDMSAIISAIRNLGIPDAAIQTTGISMYYDQQQRTYQVSNNVSIQSVSVSEVTQIYSAAADAGANTFNGITFDLKNSKPAQDQALQAALADARRRADVEAKALGLQITGVQSTSELPVTISTPPCQNGCGGGGGQPVENGQLAVTADVTVTYNVQ